MASTYSALKIELIGTGDQTGTWGATTNVNLGDAALGEAITGSADVAFSSADVTITLVDTNATQTARNLRLNLTGTSGGARNLILGSGCQIEKLYLVNNGLADAVTVKNTTGTGIAVAAGKTMFVYNNGTNVVDAITHLTSLTTGVLSASGATTFTAGTASTSTTTGTAVITGGLGVSGRVNAANFDGIVGANTAAAGSFTTINASTSITNAGLTSGRVTFAGASGLLTDSANLTFDGTMLSAPVARFGTFSTFGTESLQVAKANGTGVVGSAYQFAINSKTANNRAEMIMTDGSTANAFISYAPNGTAASDRLTFNLQGSDIVTVVGNGRVGIGTSSPNALLEVYGGDIRLRSTSNGANGFLTFVNTSGVVASSIYNYNGLLSLNEQLIINNSSGNVGIGTSSPAYTLAVNGTGVQIIGAGTASLYLADGTYQTSITSAGNTIRFNGDTGTERMRIDSSGSVQIRGDSTDATFTSAGQLAIKRSSSDPVLSFHANAGSQIGNIQMQASGTCSISVAVAQPLAFNVNGSERMRIDSSGNVGIGTSSPAYKLVVIDTANAKQQITFSDNATYFGSISHNSGTGQNEYRTEAGGGHGWFIGTSTTTANMILDPSGNLILNSATPAYLANTSNLAQISINRSPSTGAIFNASQSAAFINIDGVSGGSSIQFATATANNTQPSEAMRINSSGNVGIGTSSPTSFGGFKTLELANSSGNAISLVTGTSVIAQTIASNTNSLVYTGTRSNHGLVFTTNDTERIRLDTSGNLGIGTSSPSAVLDVEKAVGAEGEIYCIMRNNNGTQVNSLVVNSVSTSSYNAAVAALWVGRASANGRSLNAGGTINASGADYAEYMTKAGDFTIAKGDVVGIDANGKLTNVFADAVTFVVKSTDPSYVGGDTWGTAESLGLAKLNDDATQAEKDTFNAALEAARQRVDRIAFSGQVPVNVTGATAGQYIIPFNDNGAIKGVAVNESDLTMSQYIKSVGKVIKVVDGKPTIIVKVT